MRLTLISLIVIAAVLAALVLLRPDSTETNSRYDFGMPWEIFLDEDKSYVFGLSPGNSTLQKAITQLGDDYELALLAKPDELGSLDLYYSHFQTWPLQGKLIISAAISEAEILAIKNNPGKQEYLDTGTKKFNLTAVQRLSALQLPIESIVLFPAAGIGEAIVHDRFGRPSQIIKINDQVSEYVYEKQGLAVRIDLKGKDILHYVSPAAMPDLISQIKAQATAVESTSTD
jgi:hypothetical protein